MMTMLRTACNAIRIFSLVGLAAAVWASRSEAVTAPVAKNQSVSTAQGSQRVFISLSYTDPDTGETRTFTLVTAPVHGTLEYYNGGYQTVPVGTAVNSGYWYYTPAAGYTGPDPFTWKMHDGTYTSNTATCSISVSANTAPVAKDQSVTTAEGAQRAGVSLSYTDPDTSQSKTFTLLTAPAHGTLEYYNSGYQTVPVGTAVNSGYWYYTPAAGHTGADSFTWKMSDGLAVSNTATCSLTVNANTPPVANNQSVTMVQETVRKYIGLSYTDPDSAQSKTFTLVSAPAQGTLEYYNSGYQPVPVGTPVSANGWYYTPPAGWTGSTSFTWKLSDGLAASNTATCSITVTANVVPVASDSKVMVVKNQAVTIRATYVDPDAQTFTLTKLSGPAHGTVTISGSNFVYTPAAGYTGTDSFTWKVNDGMADSNVATCRLLVREENDPSGMLVVLAVNSLLLPEVQTQVDRLKADLIAAGYTSTVKPWNPSTDGGTANLWSYLRSEYHAAGQFLAGAILIGNMPKATNTSNGQYTDLAYWNMETLGETTTGKRHIWVSRMWALSSSGGSLTAGSEVTLLRRALDANHYYRAGMSRLPHNVYHYDSAYPGAAGDMNNALTIWPAVEYLSPHLAFQRGGELIHEESHGSSGSYNEGNTTTDKVHHFLAQMRFVNVSSCSSGAYGGVVNNQLLTRGGGNVLSYGATATAYSGQMIIMQNDSYDVNFRARLAGGMSWGEAMLSSFPFSDYYRMVFYGDLSIPAKSSPANAMPTITSFTASKTTVYAGEPVTFTVVFSDPDAASSDSPYVPFEHQAEWFMAGFNGGRNDPTCVTDSTQPGWTQMTHSFSALGANTVRVQVMDEWRAVAWKELTITVEAGTNTPPTISDVANQTTAEDTAKGPVSFTIGDLETAVGSLTVTGTSSNTTLLPNANIVCAGSTATRTVTMTPASNQSGTTTVTLTVTDGGGLTATDTFVLTVTAVNDAPVIDSFSPGTPLTMAAGTSQLFEVWATDVDAGDTLSYAWKLDGASVGTNAASYTYSPTVAGTYTLSVTVSDGKGGTVSHSWTVTVTANPAITLSPATLSRSCTVGANASSQTFTVTNSGGGTLSWTVSDNVSWLSCSPTSGTSTGEADTVTVSYTTSALAVGTHTATITVAGGTGVTSKTIAVTLTVTAAPVITLSLATLSRSCTVGANASSQTFTVTNSGGGTLSWTVSDNVSWLSCSPTSGTSTGEADTVTVSYTTSALAAGTHSATITVAGGTGVTSKTIAVTLTVTAAPAITLSLATLSPSCTVGANASSQTFTVTNSGGGTLSWTVSDNVSWLSCSPTSGTSTGEADTVTVSYNTSGLDVGTYNATITVAGGTGVTSGTIPVTLTVKKSSSSSSGGGCSLSSTAGPAGATGWLLPWAAALAAWLAGRRRRRSNV